MEPSPNIRFRNYMSLNCFAHRIVCNVTCGKMKPADRRCVKSCLFEPSPSVLLVVDIWPAAAQLRRHFQFHLVFSNGKC